MRVRDRSLAVGSAVGHHRRIDLEPAHLRSFTAIVRYGGYHRAAEALHLTQPAVSRHIRRLEEQLGERLFVREGRGVHLTAFGERAALELAEVLAVHDRALLRLLRGADQPFVFGSVEHLTDSILPSVLSVLREQLERRPVQMRIDRSEALADALRRGELGAAIVLDPFEVPDPIELGSLSLGWWRGAGGHDPETLPDEVPIVAYDAPCAMRDLSLDYVRELGSRPRVAGESPHMAGVHAAARAGLGYALLAEGGDGLVRCRVGPLAAQLQTRLWLIAAPEHRALVEPLRAAAWRGMRAARLLPAA